MKIYINEDLKNAIERDDRSILKKLEEKGFRDGIKMRGMFREEYDEEGKYESIRGRVYVTAYSGRLGMIPDRKTPSFDLTFIGYYLKDLRIASNLKGKEWRNYLKNSKMAIPLTDFPNYITLTEY